MKQEPIRIAQIIGKWLGGGVEAVVMNYYCHIDKTKIQFDFICDDDSTDIPKEEIESLGGKVILIPPYQKAIKYHRELKRVLKEGKYKIVHSHINTLSVFSLFAAKCAGVPVRIAHSHSTTNKKEKKKNLMKQILRPFSKLFATDYMCCSELAGRWLFGNKEYDKGNVYLLNNAIDLEKFKYDENVRKEVRKELNIDDNKFVIGHIGRFVEQKNHTFLIDIFNEVHKENENTVLLLVGQGPLQDSIKEKVKNLGLDNNVKFLGQRNDTNRLYQAFDVFVLPSLYEGLPVVGIEAQAAGLPCVLSDEMTKETKINNNAYFYSLNSNAIKWSNKIMDNYLNIQKENQKQIMESGFDIRVEGNKLTNYYINKDKKTILHIVNSKIFSGLESVACDIIKSPLKYNYNFIYVTQEGPIVEILKEKNIQYEIIEKVNVKEIRRIVKKYNPNVIHAHDYTVSCICALAGIKTKIISHLHNNSPWIKTLHLYSFLYLFCSTKFSKILTVSDSIEKEYIFARFIKNKIQCIGNPVSRNKILENVTNEDFEKKWDICCVARLTEPKNPKRFIKIIDKIKKSGIDIKSAWVGDGELKEEFLSMIQELNLQDNIEFIGFQKNPYKYMAQSKIFMLTSDWEGYGLVAFEALTLGLPAVVSNVGGLPNIVDENCGKVCESDEDFIEELFYMLKNRHEIIEKGKNAICKSNKLDNSKIYYSIIKTIYNGG